MIICMLLMYRVFKSIVLIFFFKQICKIPILNTFELLTVHRRRRLKVNRKLEMSSFNNRPYSLRRKEDGF